MRADRISSVVRKLHFEPYQTPLVAPPPDIPHALVVKKSYRKEKQDGVDDKESQDCEDDTRTSKEVIILTCYVYILYVYITDIHVRVFLQLLPGVVASQLSPPASPATHSSSVATTADETTSSVEEYPIGSMVWGRLQGYDWWPGMVISYCKEREGDTAGEGEGEGSGMQVWVKWYGENNLSQVSCHIITLHQVFQVFKPYHQCG